MEKNIYRSGFVSLIGRTNVGKSTLMNQFIGEKLSIVSDKPQTTRNRIQCILSRQDGQAVFLDTPGLHKTKTVLGERMNRYAVDTIPEVDLILFVVTADSTSIGKGDQTTIEQLQRATAPIYLVINKADLAESPEHITALGDMFAAQVKLAGRFVISALHGDGVTQLCDAIFASLPEGPQYYPDDMIIDQPERFLAAEIIREKVLHLTRDEIPHGVAVDIDSMKENDEGMTVIAATIYVDRESPKRIIIGAKGSMLKEIGSLARKDLEDLLGMRVYLELWVKVREGWRDNERSLREFGYRK